MACGTVDLLGLRVRMPSRPRMSVAGACRHLRQRLHSCVENGSETGDVFLGDRRRSGALDPFRQISPLAAAQRIGGDSCRGADATDKVCTANRTAQHLSLLLDDGKDQPRCIALHTWSTLLRPQSVHRNVDDAYLVWYEAKNLRNLGTSAHRQRLQPQ